MENSAAIPGTRTAAQAALPTAKLKNRFSSLSDCFCLASVANGRFRRNPRSAFDFTPSFMRFQWKSAMCLQESVAKVLCMISLKYPAQTGRSQSREVVVALQATRIEAIAGPLGVIKRPFDVVRSERPAAVRRYCCRRLVGLSGRVISIRPPARAWVLMSKLPNGRPFAGPHISTCPP